MKYKTMQEAQEHFPSDSYLILDDDHAWEAARDAITNLHNVPRLSSDELVQREIDNNGIAMYLSCDDNETIININEIDHYVYRIN